MEERDASLLAASPSLSPILMAGDASAMDKDGARPEATRQPTPPSISSTLAAAPALVAPAIIPTVAPEIVQAAGMQLDFIKGFIAGQLVVFLLLWFLVRLVFLRNTDEADAEMKRRLAEKSRSKKRNSSSSRRTTNGADSTSRYLANTLILNKIYADVETHADESCDWLNVLIAQGIEKYRRDQTFQDWVVSVIDQGLNGGSRPGWLGPILITEFSLGEEFPVIKSARIRPSPTGANVRAELVFELRDHITLGIDTHLVINWPRPGFATLPISLALSVVNFKGTIAVELVNGFDPVAAALGNIESSSFLSVSILDDYVTEFDVRSLLGHRTKIKDLPKLTELLTSRLRALFEERLVEPRCFRWSVPDIGKRKGAEEEQDGDVSPAGDSERSKERIRRNSGYTGERQPSPTDLPERGRLLQRFEGGQQGPAVVGHAHLRQSHSRS